ncbi:hypothetical protein [Phenylobacterium sp.]|uniref:hypothetical protein n=1 Tax=Phenylobacterium sp. TaxID=1871053 RepID=UPI003BAB0D4D
MSGSRNNHYVPEWHQRGFIEPGQDRLAYLDLSPRLHRLKEGGVKAEQSRFKSYPSQCFVQRDLYSTFFGTPIGTHVNDEIERKLFGTVDTTGAPAVKAFAGSDVNAWLQHFQELFTYIDIQKLRTPRARARNCSSRGIKFGAGRKLVPRIMFLLMRSNQTASSRTSISASRGA